MKLVEKKRDLVTFASLHRTRSAREFLRKDFQEHNMDIEKWLEMPVTIDDIYQVMVAVSEEKPEPSTSMIRAIDLIDRCVKAGLIDQDPKDSTRIMVYRTDTGWCSEDIFDAALELSEDPSSVRYLEEALRR